MNVSVPGTYNGWRLDDDSVLAEREERRRYVVHRVLPRGMHRFKFVVEGDWRDNYGCADQARYIAPMSGPLAADGQDIVVNAPDGGAYTFTLDLARNTWSVEAAPHSTGLAQALNGASGAARAQTLLKLAEKGDVESSGFTTPLRDLLLEQTRNGMLPLRNDQNVLFTYLAQPWEQVQVAASWLGWGHGLLDLQRVHNSDLHVRLVEVPVGVHSYKVVYNGQWVCDASNPWVTPDGIPVPKFHLGDFNSVVAVDASPLESGHNLLWYPQFESVVMGNARDVYVWLPPSYLTQRSRRYRTLYVLDGNETLTRNFLHLEALHQMQQGLADDVILVLVTFHANNERMYEMADPEGRERYARFFVQELVPYIDSQFRTEATPQSRGLLGVSLGGNFAYYAAWRWPDVFGCAAGQGASWQWNAWDIVRLFQSEPARPIRLYLDSSYPTHEGGDEDNSAASRHTAAVLSELGYSVHHHEMAGQAHDWGSWKERQPEVLRWFAPVARPAPRRRATAVT